MNPAISNAATAYLAPKVLRGFRLRWLMYGAVAYYGLRFMQKRGIFPEQTGRALDIIDRGIGMAKDSVGLGSTSNLNSTSSLSH